jgi:hypothetical protein
LIGIREDKLIGVFLEGQADQMSGLLTISISLNLASHGQDELQVKVSHERLLKTLATGRLNAAVISAHSPGVLKYLRTSLGSYIPNPNF